MYGFRPSKSGWRVANLGDQKVFSMSGLGLDRLILLLMGAFLPSCASSHPRPSNSGCRVADFRANVFRMLGLDGCGSCIHRNLLTHDFLPQAVGSPIREHGGQEVLCMLGVDIH